MTAADLRAMLVADHLTHVPGVWDPASAALAVRAGHRALLLSGPAISATTLGRTDLGLAPPTQIADRAAGLVPALDGVPLLADADIGYDEPESAVWTALAYERAGISGICLDDGEDGAARIAALAEQVPGVALIALARGDGLAATIDRCRAYAAAGADAVLPVGITEATDLALVRAALPAVPLALSRSEAASGHGRLSAAELAQLGVRLVLHPLAGVLAALRAASTTYRAIAEDGNAERVDRLPVSAFRTVTDTPGLSARSGSSGARPGTSGGRPRPVEAQPGTFAARSGRAAKPDPAIRPGPAATPGAATRSGGTGTPGTAARPGSAATAPWQIDRIDT